MSSRDSDDVRSLLITARENAASAQLEVIFYRDAANAQRARAEAAESQLTALRRAAAGLYRGFEHESLNGVICSIPDTGLDTPPHRTWCASCRRRWKGLKALGEPSTAISPTRTGEAP